MDPFARGAWIGLSLAHSRSHLLRSVLEGVAFALKDVLLRLGSVTSSPQALHAVGGALDSPTWTRIIAAALNTPLRRHPQTNAAALGAAILASVGGGLFDDVEKAVAALVPSPHDQEEPDPALTEVYVELYEQYTQVYPALKTMRRFQG
jgi:xylulokinase